MLTTLAATVDDSAELLGDCPYPVPDQIDVKAAATFGGFLVILRRGNDNNCLRFLYGFYGSGFGRIDLLSSTRLPEFRLTNGAHWIH